MRFQPLKHFRNFQAQGGNRTCILHILSPFLLGGAIAFILNVPMCRIQKRLFGRAAQGSKMERAAALMVEPNIVFTPT